jgi:1-phosphatidylinositol phosphodiesterase
MEEFNNNQRTNDHIDDICLDPTNSNHTRWMTEIGPDIEHLKIHDLILAEAHNAGVDQKGAGWPADQWAACQDDTFAYQLRNGIRALDLRLYRQGTSYIFKHGGYHASRELNRCLDDVSAFARTNPGEIVILDFHEVVVDGGEAQVASSLQLRLGDQCIPATARNLTIGQIRNRFPGKNVIVAWNHPNWFCWEKVHQTWTGNNLNNETAINNHINSTLLNPPTNKLWSMFAAGYNDLGPIRFKPHTFFWNSFFNKVNSASYRQPSNGNMINVDFFAGTGVIDRCITATRERASKARLSVPTRLTASNITNNSIRLSWSRPQDAEAVTGYTLHANERFVTRTTNTFFVFSGLTEGTAHHLQVIPHYASGDGAAAEITAVTVDATKPSNLPISHLLLLGISRRRSSHGRRRLTMSLSPDTRFMATKSY